MSPIKSRKHAAPFPSRPALGLMLAALPGVVLAQQAEAPQTLPALKASAAAEDDYKADRSASPKLSQPLLNTPQTVTVIKQELLREQGATTLSEALRNTPGITMLMGENGNTTSGDAIFMRGFDTQGSIFVDGMRDLGQISRDVFNIEQVEVIKGPSGADTGRAAASGYINMITKVPSLEAFGNASLSVGDADRVRATLDLNRPLDIGLPGSALRLNLMVQDYGVPGRDEVKNKRYGVAPSLALGLNTPTRAYFTLLHSRQDNRPDGGVPTVGQSGYFNAALSAAGVQPPKPDSSLYYGSLKDYEDVTIDMFTVRVEHDLAPGVTLRNSSRYGRSTQEALRTGVNALVLPADLNDFSAYQVARTRQGKYQENEILTNQTQLSAEFGSGAVRHAVVGGVELAYEKQYAPTYALPSGVTQAAANLYAPSTSDTFVTPVRNGAYSRGSTRSVALYAFDTLKLGAQWELTAGVRLEKYKTELDSAALSTLTTYPTLPEGTLVPVSLAKSGNLFGWKLGALYKPAPNGSVYVSAANSEQPPGGANLTLSSSVSSASNPSLDPQKGSNLELGTKWEFLGGSVALAGALFRAENRNELVQDAVDTTLYTQVGKRRVQGLELSVVGQVTQALQLNAGLVRMDSEILRAAATTQGGDIQWSPKLTFTSWATYKLPFGLTVGGGARYVDNAATTSNVDTRTTTGISRMPAYWVVDALVSYPVSRHLNLQLNLYNLFDETYLAAVNNGRSRYTPGPPRSALLTANLQF